MLAKAMDLYPKDADFERGAIGVLHAKGDMSRVKWMDVRASCGHDWSRPLFCTSSSERVTNAQIGRVAEKPKDEFMPTSYDTRMRSSFVRKV